MVLGSQRIATVRMYAYYSHCSCISLYYNLGLAGERGGGSGDGMGSGRVNGNIIDRGGSSGRMVGVWVG